MEEVVAVLTPVNLIKPVCDILKSKNLLGGKVVNTREDDGITGRKLLVFTTLQNEAVVGELDLLASSSSGEEDERAVATAAAAAAQKLWMQLGLAHMKERLSIRMMGPKKCLPQFWQTLKDKLTEFVLQHPPPPSSQGETQDNIQYQQHQLIENIPTNFKYDLYPPLLLLPPSSPFLTLPLWKNYISYLTDKQKNIFFSLLAGLFKATHIAINAPIPSDDNIIRRPLVTPLYGTFGSVKSDSIDNIDISNNNNHDAAAINKNIDDTFWVSTTQNGIYQTWAPMHTMFSRGNIREKTRILEKISADVDKNFTVVDLYVGIGYFTFSYLKAGARLVLGWDINPWSIEGCRRGAVHNGWTTSVVVGKDVQDQDGRHRDVMMEQNGSMGYLKKNVQDSRLLLFNESNIHAPSRMEKLMEEVGYVPVRYVNLGLLPTSRPSYILAVQILLMNRPNKVGTVFVHENVGQNEISPKAIEIVQAFHDLLTEQGGKDWVVDCRHVEKVKSWAPGVFHCVFDIVLTPTRERRDTDG